MSELAPYTPPGAAEIDYTWNLANKLCKTEFVPSNLRNRPEATLAVFLTGRELGIGPMQSLRDIYPVNGRPALMASLMVARVRGLGHRFKTLESTDTSATVQIHRKGDPEPEPPVTFTVADAKRAGLLDKAIWRQYPKAMLWNRAASAACRRDCPEALGGAVYTPEELGDGDGTTTATWGAPEASEPSDPGSRAPSDVVGGNPASASPGSGHPSGGVPDVVGRVSAVGEATPRDPTSPSSAGEVADDGDHQSPPVGLGKETHAGGDPKSPPAPNARERSPMEADRVGAEGAQPDGTEPGADTEGPQPPDATKPPEGSATPPGRPSGGNTSPAGGGAKGARPETPVRGRQGKQGESHGAAAGRATTEEADQAKFEAMQAEKDDGRWTR